MSSQIAFVPITKVDELKREVWGWGAIEQPDASNEIMDYASSRIHFQDWSDRAQKRSGGKSQGNLRSMHQTISAGKLIDFRADDTSKGFFIGTKIVDDQEWKKVQEGVYTGFSVGGSYLKRWPDQKQSGLIRYTAKPSEISLVDAPCIPDATFQMVKAEGIYSLPFKHGTNMIKVVIDEDEVEEELEKAIPCPPTPMAIADETLKGNFGHTEVLHHMPPPSSNLELKSNTEVPSTEMLTQALVKTKELTDMVQALIGSIPGSISKAITEEFDKIRFEDPPSDTRRMIKVERK